MQSWNPESTWGCPTKIFSGCQEEGWTLSLSIRGLLLPCSNPGGSGPCAWWRVFIDQRTFAPNDIGGLLRPSKPSGMHRECWSGLTEWST